MGRMNIGATSATIAARLLPIAGTLGLATILGGCAINVRAYPINKEAQPIGMLDFSYQMGLGHGPVTIKIGDGAIATGEFQTFYFDQAPPGFGALYRASYKVPPEPGGRAGMASARDSSGRSFNCEYYLGSQHKGTGVCRADSGALFQIIFTNAQGG